MGSINTIFVPQGAEYQAVCRGLQQANLDSIDVIAIPLGVIYVTQVLAQYSEQVSNSRQILIMGLAGSLSDNHHIGDSVILRNCQDLNHNLVELDAELTAEIQQKLSIEVGKGLTSDRVIVTAQEKLALAQQYSSSIVEMEGYSYVKELQRQNKAVAVLRVVSDDLHGDIPDLNQAIDDQGNLQTLPMAIALIKQPIAAIRLIQGSLTGLKALQEITTKLFK